MGTDFAGHPVMAVGGEVPVAINIQGVEVAHGRALVCQTGTEREHGDATALQASHKLLLVLQQAIGRHIHHGVGCSTARLRWNVRDGHHG